MEEFEVGPMAHIRENYCMKSSITKDIMKAQNSTRRAADDIKLHNSHIEMINERIDKLD